MITAIRSCARQGRMLLRSWWHKPIVYRVWRICQCLFTGFFLSAASLGHYMQPLAMGAVCTAGLPSSLLTALGGALGYRIFWGETGFQGVVWMVLGLLLSLIHRPMAPRGRTLLLCGGASFAVAVTGLLFQIQLGDTTPISVYLLRLVLAPAAAWLFRAGEQAPSPMTSSLTQGVWVLALAQVMPAPWLCPGFAVAGARMSAGSFSAAALAGLALDMAQITPVPMTAVACFTWFIRQIPGTGKWLRRLVPVLAAPVAMILCGNWDPVFLPMLALGSILGSLLPEQTPAGHRRGETGIAQVRLELAAGVFTQMQQLLLEVTTAAVDEAALVRRAADRACGGCPCRKGCKEREAALTLSPQLLHRPLLDGHDLGLTCRKEARLLLEMHRAQEHLRTIRNGREQQKECRNAVIQQYRFLSEYLQDLSDELGRRARSAVARYQPQVYICANRLGADNGDRFLSFPGPGCCHYVLLCDGMGTGSGAIDEGSNAASLLKKLLTAGFPVEYALRSLNSLCALRGLAGAVTMDLVQLQLDTGKANLFKWGAAPSYLLKETGAEKIGTAGPPPGLSVTEKTETVERLSLRRGETLVLCSDGVEGAEALHSWCCDPEEPPGELAVRILKLCNTEDMDDATVAVVRLGK